MKQRALTWSIFGAIVVNDMADGLAQLLMKKGLVQTGIDRVSWANLPHFLTHNIASGLVWFGILVYALNFFLWILILSRVELSIAMPLGSTAYVVIPILAMIFLHEKVGLGRWIGIALIMTGIYCVSTSSTSKTPAPTP